MSTGWTAPGSTAPEPPSGSGPAAGPDGPGPAGSPGARPAGPRRELVQQLPLFPLRPLSLGEVLSAAVRIYRLRARDVLVLAAAVYGVAFVLITVITGAGMIPFIGQMQAVVEDPTAQAPGASFAGDALTTVASSLITVVITILATALVTVALTRIAIGEATGDPLPSGQIGATVRRLALPAIVVSAIVSLLGMLAVAIPSVLGALPLIIIQEPGVLTIGSLLAGLAIGVLAGIYIWSRTILAVPALVIEGGGILTAVRRTFAMTAGRRLWRVLGIGVLLYVLYMIATQTIAGVFGVVATVVYIAILLASQMQALAVGVALMTVIMMLGSYIASFLLAPFLSAGLVAVYADNRMRHEAWDVELNRRARAAHDTAGGPGAPDAASAGWAPGPGGSR